MLSVVLFLFGIILIIGSRNKKREIRNPNAKRVQAVISDIYTTGYGKLINTHVTVEYELDGVLRTASLDSYNPAMKIGSTVEVVLDPVYPDIAHSTSAGNPRILLIVGIVFIILAIILRK